MLNKKSNPKYIQEYLNSIFKFYQAVLEILEEYRIGNLDKEDVEAHRKEVKKKKSRRKKPESPQT